MTNLNQINLNLISPGNILIKDNSWDKRLKKNKTKTKRYVMKYVVPYVKIFSTDPFSCFSM